MRDSRRATLVGLRACRTRCFVRAVVGAVAAGATGHAHNMVERTMMRTKVVLLESVVPSSLGVRVQKDTTRHASAALPQHRL